jgi:adenylate kinase family enzyme
MKRMKETKKIKRVDDNVDSIKKRFETFKSDTLPVVEEFRKENKVRKVNGEDSK